MWFLKRLASFFGARFNDASSAVTKTFSVVITAAIVLGVIATIETRTFDFYIAGWACPMNDGGECSTAETPHVRTLESTVGATDPIVIEIPFKEAERKAFARFETGVLENAPKDLKLLLNCSLKVGGFWGGYVNDRRSYQCPRDESNNCLSQAEKEREECQSVIRSIWITLVGPDSESYDVSYKCASAFGEDEKPVWHVKNGQTEFSNGTRCDPNKGIVAVAVEISSIPWWKFATRALRTSLERK